jgi:hypothetical protein
MMYFHVPLSESNVTSQCREADLEIWVPELRRWRISVMTRDRVRSTALAATK